jgi:Oxidoreductase molybdopterin binding domain
MNTSASLPPGQRETPDFPRFGLTPFALRFPTRTDAIHLQIGGDLETHTDVGGGADDAVGTTVANAVSNALDGALKSAARVAQCSDFHCVTTWTHKDLHWSGIRFADFYSQIVVPLACPAADATFVVLRGQDGARTSLPLQDLLAPDVLLADRLNGHPLSVAHGAPLRLVAPGHYGYKSVKHLSRIEFWAALHGAPPSPRRPGRARAMGAGLAVAPPVPAAGPAHGTAV